MQAPKCGPAAQYPSGLCQSGQCPHREASASCCRPHREPQISPVNCPGQNYAATLGGTAQIQFVYRSEEHTSELQSLMRISYAVFCLKKKNTTEHPMYDQLSSNNINLSNQVYNTRTY